jgi:Ice-binding-like
MSIILRDATNPSNLAAIDPDGDVHVTGDMTISQGTPSPVDSELGSSAKYALLAGAGITNTGNTVVNGGVIGSYPTPSISGFPPGIAVVDNADAGLAQSNALTAYNFYSGLAFTSLSGSSADLSVLGNGVNGHTYTPGNYSAGSSMDIPNTFGGITLDALGNPDAIFVFKAGSTLKLESGSSITLANGALADNVIWIVGSSFTQVGSTDTMQGNILANTSITLNGGTLNGRALAGIVTSSGVVTIAAAEVINVPASSLTSLLVNIVNFPMTLSVTNFPAMQIVEGDETHNTAAPEAAAALEVLPAIANAAPPTYTEGNNVLLSTDLAGNLRTTTTLSGTVAVTQSTSPWVVSGTVTTTFPASPIVWIEGHTGAIIDGVITAATAPPNALATLSVNQTTAPSLTAGQSVAQQADYVGSQFVKPFRRSQTVAQATTIASSAAATTVLAAQAAGIFADIASILITATPALTTALVFTATLSDGTNNYVFDMDTGTVAASSGPINLNFSPPIPATTSATAWTITLSIATVTVHITTVAVLQKAS